MVGGGNRKVEGTFTVSNANVFAALDSLRRKKKSDKEKGLSKGGKSLSKAGKLKEDELKEKVYWAPAPLTAKSWADVDDEDDDDYYATTAPPQAIWRGSGLDKAEDSHKSETVEESESEDELLDEGGDDDDDVEELDHENEVEEKPEPEEKRPVNVSPAPKETERQLSKKERRKKELAELEAILADFGVNPKSEDDPSDAAKDKKEAQPNGNAENKDNIPAEPKSAKKKKKKDKATKEAKDPQDQPNNSDNNEHEETAGPELAEEDASAVDVKERLKKMASAKKKKSYKDMDGAARAAALEAAARSAKLAAAKKKEKNHYNQQPIR